MARSKSLTKLPPIAERRRAVDYAMALIDHAIEVHRNRDTLPKTVPYPTAEVELPLQFMREFTEIIWILYRLTAIGLSNREPSLPTVIDALESLRLRLQSDPKSFWTTDTTESDFQRTLWALYSKFDWLDLDGAPIAVSCEVDDKMIEAVARLCWAYRHLAKTNEPATDVVQHEWPEGGSLFKALRGLKGRSQRQLIVSVECKGVTYKLSMPVGRLKSEIAIKRACTDVLRAAQESGFELQLDLEEFVAATKAALRDTVQDKNSTVG